MIYLSGANSFYSKTLSTLQVKLLNCPSSTRFLMSAFRSKQTFSSRRLSASYQTLLTSGCINQRGSKSFISTFAPANTSQSNHQLPRMAPRAAQRHLLIPCAFLLCRLHGIPMVHHAVDNRRQTCATNPHLAGQRDRHAIFQQNLSNRFIRRHGPAFSG